MIQSDLIYLTPVTKGDANLFIDIYTDPEVMKNVGPAFNQKATMKMFNQCVKQFDKQQPANLLYVIKSKHDHMKFGIAGFMWNQNDKSSVEIGVMIAKPYISKGYAYKSLCLMIKYSFEKLSIKTIILICSKDNFVVNRGVPTLGFQNISISGDISINKELIKWKITSQRFNKINKNT